MFKKMIILMVLLWMSMSVFGQSVDTAWVRRYNGPANWSDEARAIAIDNSGNVYVTGWSYGSGTYEDYATIKYDSQGNQLWVQRYNGSANYHDYAYAIATGNSGNVYVTGGSYGSVTSEDYATIKYDSLGNQLWVQRYNGPGNFDDRAYAIAIDNSGNVYVTGASFGTITQWDYATIKYDSQGNQLWVQRYDGPANLADNAYAIAIDNSGNVYVTGFSAGTDTSDIYATVKYDSLGNELWVETYGDTSYGFARAYDIAVDYAGNVYVTGSSWAKGTATDYATIKYVQFARGDCNKDKKVTVSDVVYLINYLFKGGLAPAPLQAGDVNCDGKVTVADVVYLINYLFKGGPPPCI